VRLAKNSWKRGRRGQRGRPDIRGKSMKITRRRGPEFSTSEIRVHQLPTAMPERAANRILSQFGGSEKRAGQDDLWASGIVGKQMLPSSVKGLGEK